MTMRISREQARAWFGQARVARLASADADGRPHLVPVVFAVRGEVVVTAVDHKPKRTPDLKRLRNIAANPEVSLLADHYSDDWDRLWWARADGTAELAATADPPDLVSALGLLTVDERKQERLSEQLADHFDLVEQRSCEFRLELTEAEAEAVVAI